MSAPKFTVSRVLVLGLPRYEVSKNGVPLAHVDDPDLARVIESHAGLVEALERLAGRAEVALTSYVCVDHGHEPCGDRAYLIEAVEAARAALAKARGEAQ